MDADELIHLWEGTKEPALCGVDIWITPYTFGSPDTAEITCSTCLDRAERNTEMKMKTSFVIHTVERIGWNTKSGKPLTAAEYAKVVQAHLDGRVELEPTVKANVYRVVPR